MIKKAILIMTLVILMAQTALAGSSVTINYLGSVTISSPLETPFIVCTNSSGSITDITVESVGSGSFLNIKSNPLPTIDYRFINNTKFYTFTLMNLSNSSLNETFTVYIDFSSIKVPENPLVLSNEQLGLQIIELNNQIEQKNIIINENNKSIQVLLNERTESDIKVGNLSLRISELEREKLELKRMKNEIINTWAIGYTDELGKGQTLINGTSLLIGFFLFPIVLTVIKWKVPRGKKSILGLTSGFPFFSKPSISPENWNEEPISDEEAEFLSKNKPENPSFNQKKPLKEVKFTDFSFES